MARQSVTRSKDLVFLIGHPIEQLSGACLPSGRDIMQNFIHFQRSQKYAINDSAHKVYEQLMPFWLKSGLPTRHKDNVIKKIIDMYSEHEKLMKNVARGNAKDAENQLKCTQKLYKLFDISHAASEELIDITEDKQFLELQRESRNGVIGSLDKKKAEYL